MFVLLSKKSDLKLLFLDYSGRNNYGLAQLNSLAKLMAQLKIRIMHLLEGKP